MTSFFEKQTTTGWFKSQIEVNSTPWETWTFNIRIIPLDFTQERKQTLATEMRQLHLSVLQKSITSSRLPPLQHDNPYPFKIDSPEIAEKWNSPSGLGLWDTVFGTPTDTIFA
eukprot:TRINITY_DN1087_c0_g1_i2.p1 TRINITY_DN1087_c0_g1~~TRINITY_DN1087_c0_g1_i2.p1  ORF type:complete len:113 (-),score=8.65 TRINITY_DN1087_c0_g1_i2:66-404(-)